MFFVFSSKVAENAAIAGENPEILMNECGRANKEALHLDETQE